MSIGVQEHVETGASNCIMALRAHFIPPPPIYDSGGPPNTQQSPVCLQEFSSLFDDPVYEQLLTDKPVIALKSLQYRSDLMHQPMTCGPPPQSPVACVSRP